MPVCWLVNSTLRKSHELIERIALCPLCKRLPMDRFVNMYRSRRHKHAFARIKVEHALVSALMRSTLFG